ncbi:MAG TPA: GAF domain-containing protein [Mycobacteriales bacterium]|nr:GAF domain-containing protein [Mycobacteriales bacterium]
MTGDTQIRDRAVDVLATPPTVLAELRSFRARRGRSGVRVGVVLLSVAVAAVAFLPTPGSFSAEDSRALVALGVLLATAGVAAGRSRRQARVSARLGEEQSALRRVGTLVARGVAPDVVLAAVAQEVGRLTGADAAVIFRFGDDGMATVAAMHGVTDDDRGGIGGGIRWTPEPCTPAGSVLTSGRSARYDARNPATAGEFPFIRDRRIRSAVAIPVSVEGHCWGTISVVSWDRPFPTDTEQRLVEFTELVAMAIANADSQVELAASRARVVAAGDQMRRRIERDLHDGAQQRLVSLAIDLRLVQDSVPRELPALRAAVGRAVDDLIDVLDELREISRGIHPAILTEGGLGPALRTLARRSAVPVDLYVGTDSRYPPPVEVAAYYVVSEALTNTAKHADASLAEVVVEEGDDALRMWVGDDGVGGADLRRGSGLLGLRDRVEWLGGSFDVRSPAGRGTRIEVSLPVGGAAAGDPTSARPMCRLGVTADVAPA